VAGSFKLRERGGKAILVPRDQHDPGSELAEENRCRQPDARRCACDQNHAAGEIQWVDHCLVIEFVAQKAK
jgi:hypothetical protein